MMNSKPKTKKKLKQQYVEIREHAIEEKNLITSLNHYAMVIESLYALGSIEVHPHAFFWNLARFCEVLNQYDLLLQNDSSPSEGIKDIQLLNFVYDWIRNPEFQVEPQLCLNFVNLFKRKVIPAVMYLPHCHQKLKNLNLSEIIHSPLYKNLLFLSNNHDNENSSDLCINENIENCINRMIRFMNPIQKEHQTTLFIHEIAVCNMQIDYLATLFTHHKQHIMDEHLFELMNQCHHLRYKTEITSRLYEPTRFLSFENIDSSKTYDIFLKAKKYSETKKKTELYSLPPLPADYSQQTSRFTKFFKTGLKNSDEPSKQEPQKISKMNAEATPFIP